MRFGRRRPPLPQDAFGREPHRPRRVGTLDELVALHRDPGTRAEALWGLIALGEAALPWCERALTSGDPETQEDAAAVLAWIGVPDAWLPRLAEPIERLEPSEAADMLLDSLSPEARARWFADETATTLADDRAEWAGFPDPDGGKTFSSVGFFAVSAVALVQALQDEDTVSRPG